MSGKASRDIRFNVIGKPEAKPRPRARRRGDHAQVYQEETPWAALVSHAAGLQREQGAPCLAGPVGLTLEFRMPRKKQMRKTKPNPHVTRPDVDNMAKGVMDCLQDVLMANDTQVTGLIATKRYAHEGEPPGCLIHLDDLAEAAS